MKEATSWKKKPLSQTTIGLSVSFLLPVDKDRDQRDQGGEKKTDGCLAKSIIVIRAIVTKRPT